MGAGEHATTIAPFWGVLLIVEDAVVLLALLDAAERLRVEFLPRWPAEIAGPPVAPGRGNLVVTEDPAAVFVTSLIAPKAPRPRLCDEFMAALL